jgi:hypothetical protein
MRYDLTIVTTGEGIVSQIAWTVRDARGEAVAIGTWQGSALAVYTPEGAIQEAFEQARNHDVQLSLLPVEGEY